MNGPLFLWLKYIYMYRVLIKFEDITVLLITLVVMSIQS